MQGLMMDYPLTLNAILGRAERIHGRKEVVSRRPDRSLHRTTYADIASRARKLAVALSALGVRTGDRVATLCWNQPEHLELYFGVPALGAVIHTLNPRLDAGELSYIVHHADDKVLVVDETLLPVFESFRAKQGIPVPFVEIRARGAEGLVPWDGQTMGELEVRGPWVARAYYDSEEGDDRFTADGWFKTGDIVTIDPLGCIEITDRAKDLIRSGGEWLSSVALENALMAHPAVAEAAVIAVPDPQWQERPLAVVVLKPGQATTQEDLLASLAGNFPKWWLPDTVEFVDEIPKTAVGKFKKAALRERFNAPPARVPGGPDAAS